MLGDSKIIELVIRSNVIESSLAKLVLSFALMYSMCFTDVDLSGPHINRALHSKRDDGAVHASDESDVVGVDTRHAACPLVSSIARMLNCSDPIGGKRYLVADLTVTCYVGWHLVYLGGACFCFIVYCLGIPTLVFTVAACKTPLVCRRRKRYDAAEALAVLEDREGAEHASGWWNEKGIAVGADVFHPVRGHGYVIDVSPDDDAKVHVEFEGGEVHQYQESGWSKKIGRAACYTSSRHAYFPPMLRCRRRDQSDYSRREVRVRFGFLFHGYETDGSAVVVGWEANVMLRKLWKSIKTMQI